MLNNLIIGPPLAGGTDFRVGERAGNGEGSDQFGSLLSQQNVSADNKKAIGYKDEKNDFSRSKKLPNKDKAPLANKEVETVKTESKKVEIDQRPKPSSDQQVKEKSQVDKKEIETASPQKKQSREQVIQKFMDSFESEFGIPSTRLVEAMKDLTPEQLRLPPEQTAEMIIAKLGLDEHDQDRAQAMYISMLMSMSKIEAKPMSLMSLNDTFATGTLAASRNHLAKERTQTMNQSVDQLNQQFWSTPAQKSGVLAPENQTGAFALDNEIANEVPANQLDELSNDPRQFGQGEFVNESIENAQGNPEQLKDLSPAQASESKNTLQQLPPHLQAQLKEVSQGTSLAAMAQKIAQQQLSHLSSEEREKMSKVDQLELKNSQGDEFAVLNPGQDGFSVGQMTNQDGESSQMMSEQNQGQLAEKSSMQKGVKSGTEQFLTKEELQKKLIAKGIDSKDTLKKLESIHQQIVYGDPITAQAAPLNDLSQNLSPVSSFAPVSVTQMDHEKNVQQLLNQAQYLVKKGGGEVKVQMTPEGLGQVQLKVELQDGKVNVHVQAESPEVKKTIESSLAELKTSLAAHKLSMEHIKVDVVNSTSSDVSAQNQNQSQNGNSGQFERDQTRQFWQQFQQNFGNPGARASMYEIGDTRNYGRRQPESLEPMTGSTQSRQKRVIEGRGQGLNVVA